MARELEEIWDGRFYGRDDMVRVDCGGCQGCSECCKDMGDTIVLDPYDMHMLARGLNKQPGELLSEGVISLHVSQGAILPHLSMVGPNNACAFLNSEGRCSVHSFRPGFCRLFPLGRYYDEEGFKYFLQKKECPKNKTKVKVYKWLGIGNIKAYEEWVNAWHKYLLDKQIEYSTAVDENQLRAKNMGLLQKMYLTPVPADADILEQMLDRIKE